MNRICYAFLAVLLNKIRSLFQVRFIARSCASLGMKAATLVPDVTTTRCAVATLIVLAGSVCCAADAVLCGVDVLQRDGFRQLSGQRVGLITNHTGLTRDGVSTVTLLHEAPGVSLTVLFSPEHGFEGKLDISKIGDAADQSTGLKIFSLYGKTRRPTKEMLNDIDTLVFDIQDIGTRFYTYISTMGEAMHAAAEHGKRFVVLDRPNPINGVDVAGPMLDSGEESFVGFHSLPVRHGMTIGELAQMFRTERKLDLKLDVIRCDGWDRNTFWDSTGLVWVNPSPNMRCLTQAILYPGIGLIETTNISVGRGTDTPFEVIGAPWIQSRQLAAALNARLIPGVTFVPVRFTPDSSKYANQLCGGINIVITDRQRFEPLNVGFEISTRLQHLYPNHWKGKEAMRLLGNRRTLDAILAGKSAGDVQQIAATGVDQFQKRRQMFLLYK
jgi:uncharacterized protein YbbC (DUF1343 family)